MRLEFEKEAWQDIEYWKRTDKNKLKKILTLIISIRNSPFSGIGKPEALKHEIVGAWSRRIDRTNRLVYKVEGDVVKILQCRYYYDK